MFGLILAIGIWLWWAYNKIVPKFEACNMTFSNIETELSRRLDLYLSASDVLKDGSEFEKGVFVKVTELRTRTDLSVDQKVSSIKNLLAVAENNPNVNSISLFNNMQRAINETESRIQIARQSFNNAVNEYNVLISQFPMNIAAKILKFKKRDYFENKS